MKKVRLGLMAAISFICTDIRAKTLEISEQSDQSVKLSEPSMLNSSTEATSKIPNFSEWKQQQAKSDEMKAKMKELLVKLKDRLTKLQNQVAELSERNVILERENSSLQSQIQELQDAKLDNDDKTKLLDIKLMNLEQEKEELLQKLFDQQMNVQEAKTVSFELSSLLNQIPAEDETTKDCIKLLQDLNDIDNRIDQILKSAEIIELNSDRGRKIEEIIKELQSMQNLAQTKINFYKKHEQELMVLCNKDKAELPKKLKQLKDQLIDEQKKYPELTNVKLEENLMNSTNIIKSLRQNKSAEQSKKIKSLEKIFHEFVGLKIKESDVHLLEKKARDFSDNIAKIEVILANFIKKNDKLEFLRNEAYRTIENEKIANDNQSEKKN